MENDFKAAAEYVRKMPAKAKTSNETKLKFYGLFKQATFGDNSESAPWAIQIESRAKWDAWMAQKGKSKMDAMTEYVALLKSIEPSWRE